MKIKLSANNINYTVELPCEDISDIIKSLKYGLLVLGYPAKDVSEYLDYDYDCVSREDFDSVSESLDNTKEELFEVRETLSKVLMESGNKEAWNETFEKDDRFTALKKAYDALTIKLADCREINANVLEDHAF